MSAERRPTLAEKITVGTSVTTALAASNAAGEATKTQEQARDVTDRVE